MARSRAGISGWVMECSRKLRIVLPSEPPPLTVQINGPALTLPHSTGHGRIIQLQLRVAP